MAVHPCSGLILRRGKTFYGPPSFCRNRRCLNQLFFNRCGVDRVRVRGNGKIGLYVAAGRVLTVGLSIAGVFHPRFYPAWWRTTGQDSASGSVTFGPVCYLYRRPHIHFGFLLEMLCLRSSTFCLVQVSPAPTGPSDLDDQLGGGPFSPFITFN